MSPARSAGTGKRSEELSKPGHEKSERRNTSDEVGEPAQGTRRSKERRRSMELLEGKMDETPRSVVEISTKLQQIAKLAHDEIGGASCRERV